MQKDGIKIAILKLRSANINFAHFTADLLWEEGADEFNMIKANKGGLILSKNFKNEEILDLG